MLNEVHVLVIDTNTSCEVHNPKNVLSNYMYNYNKITYAYT